jgi:hypothetical protein
MKTKTVNDKIKFESHGFYHFHLKDGYVYASRDGLITDKQTFISWKSIKQLLMKFNIF